MVSVPDADPMTNRLYADEYINLQKVQNNLMLPRLTRVYAHLKPTAFRTIMTSNTNTSGLTPEQTRSLKERSPTSNEERIIRSLKQMYTCSPKQDTFDIYTENAVFHDPIGIANGRDKIRSQFVALVKLFPRADIPKFRVLENPSNIPSSTLLIDQDVAYFRDPKASTPTKTMNSLLTIKINSSNQIESHIEEWDHKKVTTGEDGFFGLLNEYRKKATADITHAFNK